jgi:hypothetical protein
MSKLLLMLQISIKICFDCTFHFPEWKNLNFGALNFVLLLFFRIQKKNW